MFSISSFQHHPTVFLILALQLRLPSLLGLQILLPLLDHSQEPSPATMYPAILLLSLLALTYASPALPPRSCQTIYPNDLQSLINALPDQSFNNQVPPFKVGGVGGSVIQQDNTDGTLPPPRMKIQHQHKLANNPLLNLQFVDFIIPPNAYGCELKITDRANQLAYSNSVDANAGPPALNVISLLPNAVLDDPTYDAIINANPSLISSHSFGTVTLQRGGSAVINSFSCANATEDGNFGHLQYVFEFAAPGMGYSDWVLPQLIADAAGIQKFNGVYMTYNC